MSKRVKVILMALAFAFAPLFSSDLVYAAEGRFEIQSTEISDKSSNVVAGTPSINGSVITSDVRFHELNDYVEYNIVLKNVGTYDRKIVNITNDNANTLFDYTYDNHADEVVEAGENLSLDVKIAYVNANGDDENRDIISAIRFNISFIEIIPESTEPEPTTPTQPTEPTEPEEQTETIEIVPEAPNTGIFGDTSVSANKDVFVVSLIVMCAGLITATILVMKKKGNAASKVAIASLMVVAIVPLTVQAEDTDVADFELVSSVHLRDRVKLSFRTMLGDESKWEYEGYYDYGDEPFANTEESYYTGYSYRGAFNVSDNSRYDYAPLSDDVDISFVYELEEYDISYELNGGTLQDGVTNPDKYTIKSEIALKNPARDGFTFDGWFDQNGDKIETIKDMVGALELEARWTAVPTSMFGITKMQQMTSTLCTNATKPYATATTYDTTGEHAGDRNYIPSVTLTDVRDQNTYQIAKLADGKCWMLENLSIADIELNSATSDLADGETFTIPESSQSGFKSNAINSAYVDSEYGGYYTWYVATAGNGSSRGLKNSSICPKNWRLPSGGSSNNDYSTLYNTAYSRNYNNFQNAIKLQYGGYMNYNERYSAGRSGFYWENYAGSLESVSYLSIYSSSSAVSAQGYTDSYNGDSIRCIAR